MSTTSGSALEVLAGRWLHPANAQAAVERAAATVIELYRGQSEDCTFETRAWVGVEEHVRMAMGKTGALMGCACALGALGADADQATVSMMDRFGRELGLAFNSPTMCSGYGVIRL